MENDTSLIPRGIPPQPTIAWFLRDLVPDKLWNEFDIGSARNEEILALQAELTRHGGSAAWLRFLGHTRAQLPQMLAISIYDILKLEVTDSPFLPRDVTFRCHPTLSVYAGGYQLEQSIRLTCTARFRFHHAGARRSNAYEPVDTDIVLKHMHWRVIERVSSQYFVPVQKF